MTNVSFADVIHALRGNETISFLSDRGHSEITLSYREFGRLVDSNRKHFWRAGVRGGDKVGICLHTTLEHCVTFLSLVSIGAIPVSVKPRGNSQDNYGAYLQKVFMQCGVKFVYHDLSDAILPKIRWTPDITQRTVGIGRNDVDPRDIAFIQFSSGSTSDPKPVAISHSNLITNISAIHRVDGRSRSSRGFNFLPLNHDMGLVGGFLSNLVTRNAITLCSTEDFARSPISYLSRFARERIEVTAMPNFMLRLLSAWLRSGKPSRPRFFDSVHTIYCGAETIIKSDVETFVERAAPLGFRPEALLFCYGLAEATLFVTGRRYGAGQHDFVSTALGRHVANVGKPILGTEVTIENADSDSGIGEICVVGPGVARDDKDHSKKLHTGDLGFVTSGDLHVTGRMKDIVIVNGKNLYVQDIEEVIRTINGIKECAAIPHNGHFILMLVAQSNSDVCKKTINSVLAHKLGCTASEIISCQTADIQRTTSGKVNRKKTLEYLKEKGVI